MAYVLRAVIVFVSWGILAFSAIAIGLVIVIPDAVETFRPDVLQAFVLWCILALYLTQGIKG